MKRPKLDVLDKLDAQEIIYYLLMLNSKIKKQNTTEKLKNYMKATSMSMKHLDRKKKQELKGRLNTKEQMKEKYRKHKENLKSQNIMKLNR